MSQIAVSILFLLVSFNAKAALAPPYVVFNELNAFLSGDSCMKEKKLEPPSSAQSNFRLLIEVCSKEKAEAWQLIKRDFSQQKVDVQFYFAGNPVSKATVKGSNKTELTNSIVKIFDSAFTGNKFYTRSSNTDCSEKGICFYPYSVTIEMEPLVIQTFVDDLHEIYGNKNLVAANHLAKLVVDNIGNDYFTITTRQIK